MFILLCVSLIVSLSANHLSNLTVIGYVSSTNNSIGNKHVTVVLKTECVLGPKIIGQCRNFPGIWFVARIACSELYHSN